MKYVLLIAFLMIASSSFAGTITGTVRDAKDGSPLTGVIVSIKNSTQFAQTDTAGIYEIKNLPNGDYELVINYVSYKKQTEKVTVKGDAPVRLDVQLKSEGNQLSGVNVKGTKVTRTESAVVMEIKKSSLVVSGISAAQISKTQDRNAADVVKRIPGVTIQDDRFITIRGLADRYNTVWLNDAGAPSSESDKRAFSFDLIPAGLIDRILVFKTPSAELPGDFAGGMVKIYTTSMPAKTEYNLGVQGSYRSGSTGNDFSYTNTHSGDALGYDNGSRNISSVVPSDIFNKNDPNIKAITQSFANDWKINTSKQQPDLRLTGSASNLFKLGSVKLGNTAGFSYTNTRNSYNLQKYDWTDTAENLHYNDQTSVNKVNLALLENLVATIGNSKIEFKNLYNQISTSSVISRTTVHDSAISSYRSYKAYQLSYENRKTYSTELSGTHHNDDNSRKYTWTGGYSSLVRNQPNIRRLWYAESSIEPGVYVAQVANNPDPNFGGGRTYINLNERIYSFSHQFTQTVKIGNSFAFDVNLGNYIEYKKRTMDMRELGYTIMKGAVSNTLLKLPVDQIFDAANVGDGVNFRMEDATHDYDHYYASNTLVASFLSLNIPITTRFKALVGVRHEYNRQSFQTVFNLDTLKPNFKTNYFLPSINLTYNFTPDMLVRAAYGKTLNRPEFREQAPSFFYNFEEGQGTYGALYRGDTLKVAEVQNVDVRWEYYPSAGELIHVGAFYKSFKNPIQQIILGGVEGFSFMNGTKAYVAGIEIDIRKNLRFIDENLGTHFLKNIVLVGNLSLSKSELTIDSLYAYNHQAQVVLKGPLQGQSNYVVNFGLFYQGEKPGVQASVLYNVYGPRMYALGRAAEGSIGELSFQSLDATISKIFAKHYTLAFGVQNLLDQKYQFVTDNNLDNKFDNKSDTPYRNYKFGRYFTVGVKVRF